MFRFPKPGGFNVKRLEAWAKFVDADDWNDKDVIRKLYSRHMMLCENHFSIYAFIDFSTKRLHKHAIPEYADGHQRPKSVFVELPVDSAAAETATSVTSAPNPEPDISVEPTANSATAETVTSVTSAPNPEPYISEVTASTYIEAFKVFTEKLQPESDLTEAFTSGAVTLNSAPKPQPDISETIDMSAPCSPEVITATSAPRQPDSNFAETMDTSAPSLDVSTVTSDLRLCDPNFDAKMKQRGKRQQNKKESQYNKCRRYVRQICKLKKQIRTKSKTDVLKYLATDKAVEELSEKITQPFAVLLQGQIINCKIKKTKGRKWNIHQKLIALQIYKRSPACYRLLRRLFCLPCQSTLKNLLSLLPLRCGINSQIFNGLKKKMSSETSQNTEYILLFEEMPIQRNLNYNSTNDIIEGFQDHGDTYGRDPQIASRALVFMIVGIWKKFKLPVAYYLSGDCVTANRLAVLIKEVLDSCFLAGVNIAATVCDVDGVNRRALDILGTSCDQPYFNHDDHEIVAVFDAPRLLTRFRNLFLKYDIKCPSGVSINGQPTSCIAKWSHISEFFAEDSKNRVFVFAPALTKDHIAPNTKQKKKVKFAAQVFSHNVAAGLFAKVAQGVLPADAGTTAHLVHKMDCLFDALNSDCAEIERGKKYAQNLSERTPHLKFLKEMTSEIQKFEFLGAVQKSPSQDCWLQTMIGVERLWRNLSNKYPARVKSLATRRLQLEPLENFFGSVRGNCSNSNPTVAQFIASFKTAVMSCITHTDLRSNVDEPHNVLSNLNHLITHNKVSEEVSDHRAKEDDRQIATILEELKHLSSAELQTEEQVCSYVCDFIFKKIDLSCPQCQDALTHTDESEFEQQEKLLYVRSELIETTEACAALMYMHIDNNAQKPDLRESILHIWRENINFDFARRCPEHSSNIINTIMYTIFSVCINIICAKKN